VNLDNIQTIAIQAIESPITTLSPEKMDAINRAIRFALDLD
jgi:mRNA-degrading endonuclease toxin of MazEF toxin-antitoxin module